MPSARLPILALFWACAASAQPNTGTLEGQVVDDSGEATPGARVTIRVLSTTTTPGGTTTVQTNDRGGYRAPNLAAGTYEITVSLEGFHPVQRQVNLPAGTTQTRDFKLSVAFQEPDDSGPIIDSVQSAAANRPGYLEQSSIAQSSILLGFGRNAGPPELATAQTLPLQETLEGFTIRLLSGEQVFAAFPIYTMASRFAAVVPANIPPGKAQVVVDYMGKASRPFPINISPAQPAFFSIRQNGQLEGIFTRLDFTPITKANPAIRGEPVIGWGTGFGSSASDTEPGLFDKRFRYTKASFYVGGLLSSPDGYIGSSEGMVGADEAIFNVPADSPTGCAVPVYFGVSLENDNVTRFSNVVTLPVSTDGSPCGDPHGFSSEEVSRLYTEGSLSIGSTFLTQLYDDINGVSQPRLSAAFEARSHTPASYEPLTPYGTCKHQWFPAGAGNPFAAPSLMIAGDYQLRLPNTTIPLRADSNLGPYANLFLRPASPFVDGAYSITFPSLNSAPPFTKQGQFRNQAGAALDAFQQQANFPANRNVCLGSIITAVQSLNLSSDVFVVYDRIYNGGPFGNEMVRCVLPGSAPALASAAASLQSQFTMIDSILVRNGNPFRPHTEGITTAIRFVPTSTNTQTHSAAILYSREIFAAERNVAVVDSGAFGTCP